MTTEIHLTTLKHIESNPHSSQRKLAEEIGVSVGKVNYCLKALVAKGQVKADNFKRSTNKMGYLYLLTPKGIEEKARLTASFLKHKIAEHEQLTKEIEQLMRDGLMMIWLLPLFGDYYTVGGMPEVSSALRI